MQFGADSTFEIMTWNLENFPKSNKTIDYVYNILCSLDIDIIALQEIESITDFNSLRDSLGGWSGYCSNSAAYDINLAYLYKTDVISMETIYEILQSEYLPLPRSPLVMKCTWNSIPLIIINNHLKCCGNGIIEDDPYDEEHRRQDASILLEEYINQNFALDNIILLGDLNDEIAEVESKNVFWNFIENDNFHFADIRIAEGNSDNWSYPSYPSHIDHILITNELFDEFGNVASEIETIRVDKYLDNGWSEYDSYISDHLPVCMKLSFTIKS